MVGLPQYTLGRMTTAEGLSPEVVASRADYLGSRLLEFSAPKPQRQKGEPLADFKRRREDWTVKRDRAVRILRDLGIERSEAVSLLRKKARSRGYKPDTIRDRAQRL